MHCTSGINFKACHCDGSGQQAKQAACQEAAQQKGEVVAAEQRAKEAETSEKVLCHAYMHVDLWLCASGVCPQQ